MRAQATRVLVRCTIGTRQVQSVMSGWSDAATRGFPVLAAMPRVASRIVGARLRCAVPLTGSPPTRHDQRWAQHARDALAARGRRRGAAPAWLEGRKTAGSVGMVSDLCFCVFDQKSISCKTFYQTVWYSKNWERELHLFDNVLAESQ